MSIEHPMSQEEKEAEMLAFDQIVIDPEILEAAERAGFVQFVPEVKDGKLVSVTVKDMAGKVVAFKDIVWFEEMEKRLDRQAN